MEKYHRFLTLDHFQYKIFDLGLADRRGFSSRWWTLVKATVNKCLSTMKREALFLDAIASSSCYPCESVSESVSQ